MKKYFIDCSTDCFKKVGENWEFDCITSANPNDKYIKIYENYDEAIEAYNSIILEKIENRFDMYADNKTLYEIDSKIEEIDEIDLDYAKILEEEYSFRH